MTVSGLPGPGALAPPLSPEAVQRRMSTDICWTDAADPTAVDATGVALTLRGVAEDHTAGGTLAAAWVHAELAPDRTALALSLDALPVPGLLGTVVGPGFRGRAMAEVRPAPGTTRWALLDELPVAALISSYAVQRTLEGTRGGGLGLRVHVSPARLLDRMLDLCAGWADGGGTVTAVRAGDSLPTQACPPAPAVPGEPGEPQPGLPPGAMRRRRVLTVAPQRRGVEVTLSFRDSFAEPEGGEVVLHEYAVTAQLDAQLRVQRIVAQPRVLPFGECRLAAASADRLLGLRPHEVDVALRHDRIGAAGCTHLTDCLRGLGSVPHLLSLSAAGPLGSLASDGGAGSPCPR